MCSIFYLTFAAHTTSDLDSIDIPLVEEFLARKIDTLVCGPFHSDGAQIRGLIDDVSLWDDSVCVLPSHRFCLPLLANLMTSRVNSDEHV